MQIWVSHLPGVTYIRIRHGLCEPWCQLCCDWNQVPSCQTRLDYKCCCTARNVIIFTTYTYCRLRRLYYHYQYSMLCIDGWHPNIFSSRGIVSFRNTCTHLPFVNSTTYMYVKLLQEAYLSCYYASKRWFHIVPGQALRMRCSATWHLRELGQIWGRWSLWLPWRFRGWWNDGRPGRPWRRRSGGNFPPCRTETKCTFYKNKQVCLLEITNMPWSNAKPLILKKTLILSY